MQQFATTGLTIGLTTIAVAGLAWLIARGRPAALTAQGGTIAPERWSAILTVIVGLLFSLFGAVAAIAGQWALAALGLGLGVPMAGFMAPSLTNLHRLSWSDEGIEGASRLFGLTLGLTRTRMAWAEIARTGKTWTGYWYIEAGDRRRIYWSYLYKGYPAFVDALVERRPDVALPDDFYA